VVWVIDWGQARRLGGTGCNTVSEYYLRAASYDLLHFIVLTFVETWRGATEQTRIFRIASVGDVQRRITFKQPYL